MSMSQLPASTVKLITSSQIITSVSSAVKELFENALDAEATSVDVKLVNYGVDRIEVKDNGSGISKENTVSMALPHYTSKISDFKDLECLETYGFRGEALNALCGVSQVAITTATVSDSMATVYSLDCGGNIVETKPAPLVTGTTVTVSCLFKNLPVRRQLMGSAKKAQEELKQVESVVKSLAIIKPNIRVTLHHNKCLIWQKTPCSSLQNSFSQIVGYSTCQQLDQISLKVNDEACVLMLIPKRDCDITTVMKATPAFSLVFVNERPIIHKKFLKILNQQLAEMFGDTFPSRKFAVCLFSVSISPSNLDVNLEPNKTKVLCTDEDAILLETERRLQTYYQVPKLDKEITTAQYRSSKHAECEEHSSSPDIDEEHSSKRRRVDEGPSIIKNNEILDNKAQEAPRTSNVLKFANEETSYSQLQKCSMAIENELVACRDVTDGVQEATTNCDASILEQPVVPSCLLFPTTSSSDSVGNSYSLSEDAMKTTCRESENSVSVGQIEAVNKDQSDTSVCESYSQANFGLNVYKDVTPVVASTSSDLEHLWDQVDSGDLNELNLCLDALTSESVSSSKIVKVDGCDSKGEDLVSTEAWSMGHVGNHKGGLVVGSYVLVGGTSKPSNELVETHLAPLNQVVESEVSPSNQMVGSHSIFPNQVAGSHREPINQVAYPMPCVQPNHTLSMEASEAQSKRSPQKSPRLVPPPKSPRATISKEISPGLDSSIRSVSSQMGRKELAAFTKFAREVRPQIILENPGISFTLVASKLAEKWQILSTEEREHYEDIARQTANCKKIWKSHDNQKKLEWIKKLPSKDEKKKITRSCERPLRKEILNNLSIDIVRAKVSKSLSFPLKPREIEKAGINLVGCLEPSGTWVFVENSDIILLNHTRLQEVVVNHRLLNTHSLSLKPLQSSEQLNQQVLGEECWKTLRYLPCSFDQLRQSKLISADIISKNGFKIVLREDNESAVLIEVAETLNYYGVRELKETLSLSKNWPDVELAQCRPLRVVNHIRSEAMRICRKSPSVLGRTMVEELLEYWKTAMLLEDKNCLHSKPIVTPIYNIERKIKLCCE